MVRTIVTILIFSVLLGSGTGEIDNNNGTAAENQITAPVPAAEVPQPVHRVAYLYNCFETTTRDVLIIFVVVGFKVSCWLCICICYRCSEKERKARLLKV